MDNKHTVLIVDDDKFLLEMYKKKFESGGVDADVALGAEEALSKLRDGLAPEVLILASTSTVIMLTNESNEETINKAKSLGIQGYIVKATSIPTEVVEKVWEIANLKKN